MVVVRIVRSAGGLARSALGYVAGDRTGLAASTEAIRRSSTA